MSFRIVLHDHDLYGSGWSDALRTSFEGLDVASYDDAPESCLNTVTGGCFPTLVFLHAQRHLRSWIDLIEQGRISAELILVRTRGGHSVYGGTCRHIHECIWSPSEFTSRPEPQQFAADIISHSEPRWDLLSSVHFPRSLVACCWLLISAGEQLDDELDETLSVLWPAALNEAVRLAMAPPQLPLTLPTWSQRGALQLQIRELLDRTWHEWAPYSPSVAVRRRLSHEWCEKRAMHRDPFAVASEYLSDLKALIADLEKAFLPGQYYELLSICLDPLSLDSIRHLLGRVDGIVAQRYGFQSVRMELTAHAEKLAILLQSESGNQNKLDSLTDAISVCLARLPKEVPQP